MKTLFLSKIVINRLLVFTILFFGFTGILFSNIIDEYGESCLEGNIDKCYQLGIIYRDGVGVMKSSSEAKEFFEIACDLGNTQACLELKNKTFKKTENVLLSKERNNIGYKSQYTNARFNFSFVYFSHLLVKKVLSDNGDGITLYNNDKSLELRAYGSWYGDNIKQIYHEELQWAKEAGEKITYKVLRKQWFVLSGVDRGGDRIFYQKTFFSNDKSASFRIEYPTKDKEKYNALVRLLNKSFHTQ